MYKLVLTSLSFAVMAMMGTTLLTTPAAATKSERLRFENCKNLEASGKLAWYGIASGWVDDPHARLGSSRPFHAKACFKSKAGCDKWVKRIWWNIPDMDDLGVAYCKSL